MTLLPAASPHRNQRAAGGIAGVMVAAYLAALLWATQSRTYDVWGAFVIGPVLVAVSLPILAHVGRRLDAPWFFNLAALGLVAKLLGAVARYLVAFVAYGGRADAGSYHLWGAQLAPYYAEGDFSVDIGRRLVGTGFIRALTGVVYAVTGPSLVGGYLVFAWLGFWGLILAIRAFAVALPAGDLRRYSLLILFLPSLVFWPSALGKEAWMMLGVGSMLYGAARLMTTGHRGFLPLLLGATATALVRPHITALLAVGVLAGFAIRPPQRVTPLTPVLKIGGLLIVLALVGAAVLRAAAFLGVEDLTVDALQSEQNTANTRTNQGGSSFEGALVRSPTDLPWAAVTILFRPFPWEAGGIFPMLASLEGILIIALVWRSRHALLRLPLMLRSHPYVTVCVAYVIVFIIAFSGFSNFGIVVRQRSLVLPAFLALLCVPLLPARPRRGLIRHG